MIEPSALRLIARAVGLEEKDLATVRLVQEPGRTWLSLYQVSPPDKAFEALSDGLRKYYNARLSGHSQSSIFASVTNQQFLTTATDPDILVLIKERPLLPAGLLRKIATGATTNRAGFVASESVRITIENGKRQTNRTVHVPKVDEVRRWVSYSFVDGPIEWRYQLHFKADGSVNSLMEMKSDAQESDPKFQPLFKAVDAEVEAEMKRAGSFGKLGSVHTFWHLKQEKLKAKGVDWRSPAELNPGVHYD
ncbi:MAG: hypothetical protein WCS99_04250 [Limisphaerales bacterium]